ncbi:MAG: hypothetical protein ABH826_03205 [Patescibacteria group bacterium]|nr:hypothetical protein [Patescibacteria group bacterium]
MTKFFQMIAALAAILAALTGCDGQFPFPGGMMGECNNGVGFVNDICSGPATEPGSLELGVQLTDQDYLRYGSSIHWELRYDRSDLVGTLDATVWDPLVRVNTPGVISEGDLEVRASIDGDQLFCEANSAGLMVYAENNGLAVEYREYQQNDDCWTKVQLDNFIVNN